MTNRRLQARHRNHQERLANEALESRNRERANIFVIEAIDRSRKALAHDGFLKILRELGVSTIPAIPSKLAQTNEQNAITFLVLWKFFHPLLEDQKVASLKDAPCIGLYGSLKDAFVALVCTGPFPKPPPGRQSKPLKPMLLLDRFLPQDYPRKAIGIKKRK